jgi:uncharacterized protein with HEPN domain
MLDNARRMQQIIQDKTYEDLHEDIAFRYAVERGIQIIGEAAFQLRRIHPVSLESISESDRIITMRHVLVHGYDKVKLDIVWMVLTTKLDPLIAELLALLPEDSV